jgi:lipopolysaccharide transport system permease protein/teichoic acid transport system permease protein
VSAEKLARPATGRFRRGWNVFRALVVAEFQDSRDLTVIGSIKWLLEPLSYMFVYFVLVASILGRSRGYAFPLFLLSALVPWRFFTGVMQGSMGLVNRFSSVIVNVGVPLAVLPPVVMATELTNMLIALVLFAPMVLIYSVDAWPSVLWLPVIVADLVLLTAGPAYLMTVFGLYFPDFRGVAQNLIRAGFFLSTALIPLSRVPGDLLPKLIKANPFSGIFDSFRAVFGVANVNREGELVGHAPKPVDLLYPALVGVVLLVAGMLLYRARSSRIPKEV